MDVKYEQHRTVNHFPTETISSYVKEVLSKNQIEFSLAKNIKGKKMGPLNRFDYYITCVKDRFEIGVLKIPTEEDRIFISLIYNKASNPIMIDKIKKDIDWRVQYTR
jgi:hypothetical protein